ncbi:hypothetical protein RAN3_1984 [plant metagenome]|uniref:Uncharacterized protein n=1 Tax=plant metagenome TaxID=1297885 RepID=A0A484V7S5_9ZZZZ
MRACCKPQCQGQGADATYDGLHVVFPKSGYESANAFAAPSNLAPSPVRSMPFSCAGPIRRGPRHRCAVTRSG